jgi:hypothetical protein
MGHRQEPAMSDFSPLTPAELQAVRELQARRTLDLTSRGWRSWTPYTRSDVADWTLDRWVLRNNARRVN